jgi:hypothetical protein
MTTPRWVALTTVAAGAATFIGTAAASKPSLALTPSTVVAGHSVLVKGSAGDCPVGDAVTVISRAFSRAHSFAGAPAAFAKVKDGGAFSVRVAIPPSRKAGRYSVTARCGGGNLGILRYVTVRR